MAEKGAKINLLVLVYPDFDKYIGTRRHRVVHYAYRTLKSAESR